MGAQRDHGDRVNTNSMEHSNRCTNAVYEAITGQAHDEVLRTGFDLLDALREAGWVWDPIWKWEPRTMRDLLRELPDPEATYYICTRGHAMAIHQGELIDYANRGFDGRHVIGIYSITR